MFVHRNVMDKMKYRVCTSNIMSAISRRMTWWTDGERGIRCAKEESRRGERRVEWEGINKVGGVKLESGQKDRRERGVVTEESGGMAEENRRSERRKRAGTKKSADVVNRESGQGDRGEMA